MTNEQRWDECFAEWGVSPAEMTEGFKIMLMATFDTWDKEPLPFDLMDEK